MLKKINEELEGDGEVTEESTMDMASRWMAIADLDGDGVIDFGEFLDFIQKLVPSENIEEEQAKDIFDLIDEDTDGGLS